jgi:hypothetical protein
VQQLSYFLSFFPDLPLDALRQVRRHEADLRR